MSQVRTWLAGIAAVCCLIGVAVTAGAAGATTPHWVGPTTLSGDPSVVAQAIPDPAGGALLYYSGYGLPTVQRVKPDGSLGSAMAVPPFMNLGNYGVPHQVAFLPNGAAIVTWQLSNYGTDYMAYLSPTGKWGAPVQTADAVTSIAVRTGEVLTSEAGGPGVTADDWTLSSSGNLTHKSGPTAVFTGNPLFGQSWVALDSSGGATVVSYGYTSSNSNEEVYQTVRKKGVWGTAKSISGTAGAIQNVVFAAAPGGHAVVAWQDRSLGTAPVMSAAIRVSGGGFGTAHALSSPTSTFFAHAIPIVAAGSDGTLAVGVSNEIGNGPYDSSYTTTNSVWLVAAGAKAFSGPKTVKGTTDKFLINSLGVVSGAALVGIHEEKITDGDTTTYPSSYHATETTTAVRVPLTGGAQLKNFGSTSGLYDGNGSEGCTPCAGTSPPPASVSGVALSGHGFEVAVGQLKPGGALSYAMVAATLPPVPVVSITSKRLTASAKSVSVGVKCSKAACRGTITLTRTVHKKTVTLGSGPYSLKAGNHAGVTVTLTKAGRSAFKNAATKSVSATVHVTVKSGRTVTKTLQVS